MSFHSREQKTYNRNRKPLSSSTNTREAISRKKTNNQKKQNISGSIQLTSINRSIATISTQSQGQQMIRNRQFNSNKQMIHDKHYDKYYKKQFPNISIIEEKQSILSNNQQNSLDSLSNFIIQGNNKQESSVLEKSNEESSEDQSEDWSLLQNEYHKLFPNLKYSENCYLQYLEVVAELTQKKKQRDESSSDPESPTLNVSQKIKKLNEEISKLKVLAKKKQNVESSSEVLEHIVQSHSFNHQKSQTFNQKSLQYKLKSQILQKSQTLVQHKQLLIRSHSNLSKLAGRIEDQQKKQNISDRLLQQLSQEENKQFEEESPLVHDQETEKQQEEFMKFMDKKYSEDNQPNLTLNNISNIMRVKTKQHHDKSLYENQNKQKEDDEVVAMLQNQLRGKQIPQIPQIQQPQIILKESRDNLCLNDLEGEIQNNIQTSLIQQQVSDENKNFFFALQAREKWIKSLQKDQKWKLGELSLLSKMKKILHNPYIQFPED